MTAPALPYEPKETERVLQAMKDWLCDPLVLEWSKHMLRKATAQLAACERERARLERENRELRVMLALLHGDASLYHDDGELQDNSAQPFIDWKRNSIDEIQVKLLERTAARLAAETEEKKT